MGDSPSDHAPEDLDSEVYPSEDDSENIEAVVQFDFAARSDRELSLKKDDPVTLYSQVSNDWWRGSVKGQVGLIPDKYISLKIKDEEKEKNAFLKSSSLEKPIRRASSSNDSIHNVFSTNSPSAQYLQVSWVNELPEDTLTVENQSPILSNHSQEVCFQNEQKTVTVSKNLSSKEDIHSKVESQLVSKNVCQEEHRETEQNEKSFVNVSINKDQECKMTNASSEKALYSEKSNKASDSWVQNHTPDLVMDLPLVNNLNSNQITETPVTSNPEHFLEEDTKSVSTLENSTSPESPDMQTAAERFAKQNQCTLKKNTKVIEIDSSISAGNSPVLKLKQINKPQIKIKPPILKRPVFTIATHASTEVSKDSPDLPL